MVVFAADDHAAKSTLEPFPFRLNQNGALAFYFDAFSSREPESTSRENALAADQLHNSGSECFWRFLRHVVSGALHHAMNATAGKLGRAGLAADRRGIARILWEQWSPEWDFDDATFERSAMAHDNPDYVDVVIHSYRHRFGLAAGDPHYADLQRRLASLPPITVPSITLDGDKDGVLPASDGSASASKFSGRRIHRVVLGAGHNVPQEAPEAFAAAVMELTRA